MASDAFFPFRDGLDAAAEYGIRAVIQPGGSHARRGGDRRGRRARHGDGVHRHAPLPALEPVDESPDHRRRRPRACAGLEVRRSRRASPKCWSRPATPAPPPSPRYAQRRHRGRGHRRRSRALRRASDVDLTIVGPEAPLVAGVVDAFAGARACAASARRAPRRSSKAPRPSPRSSCAATASRPRRSRTFTRDDFDAGLGARAARADRGQGERPRRRQGRGHRRRTAEEAIASAAGDVRRPVRRGRPRGRDRGVPRGRGSELHRHGGRRARAAARDLAGPQAPATTATAAPTPAAWAPIRRRRWSRRQLHARIMREVIEPTIRGLAADGTPYTGFLYAGLMIAAGRHAERARVQLPLRRPGDPADADAAQVRSHAAVRGGARRPPRHGAAPSGTRARRSAWSWPRPATRTACARAM